MFWKLNFYILIMVCVQVNGDEEISLECPNNGWIAVGQAWYGDDEIRVNKSRLERIKSYFNSKLSKIYGFFIATPDNSSCSEKVLFSSSCLICKKNSLPVKIEVCWMGKNFSKQKLLLEKRFCQESIDYSGRNQWCNNNSIKGIKYPKETTDFDQMMSNMAPIYFEDPNLNNLKIDNFSCPGGFIRKRICQQSKFSGDEPKHYYSCLLCDYDDHREHTICVSEIFYGFTNMEMECELPESTETDICMVKGNITNTIQSGFFLQTCVIQMNEESTTQKSIENEDQSSTEIGKGKSGQNYDNMNGYMEITDTEASKKKQNNSENTDVMQTGLIALGILDSVLIVVVVLLLLKIRRLGTNNNSPNSIKSNKYQDEVLYTTNPYYGED